MVEIEILYEDNHLLILNKPAGLLTQPSGTEQDSLEKQAKEWIKSKYNKPGNVFLEAAHRLDKPVSGIVVFCKTSKALSRIHEAIRNKKTRKTYYALVEGSPPEKEGTLENYMVHDDFSAQIVAPNHPKGKLARLHYKTIKTKDQISCLEIHLETGRYHQIRLQLSEIGCPILGDKKYGSTIPFSGNEIALHHFRLEMPHPVKNDSLLIEAPFSPLYSSFVK